MPFVCVQPMLTSWARRTEDLTVDKTDEKDAVLIARLTAQLRCYAPEPVEETWGRLRHLGARREELITANVAQIQQIRDLLECVWPAALETAAQPFRSTTWAAAMTIVVDRDGGDLDRTRRLGWARFEKAVRREITKRGGQKPCLRIARKVFTALADPAGVIAHRRGAFERIALVLEDWAVDAQRLAETERRMSAVLDELELTALVTSIHGLSAVGAAAILAETGDPAPVRHRPGTGQARRPGAPATTLRHLHRPDPPERQGPTPAAGRGLARGLGGVADQHRLRRPLSTPHHSRDQQAQANPGPQRDRRRAPAPAPRRGHHRPGLGPSHRGRRHRQQREGRRHACCLRLHDQPATRADGRGEPSAASRTTRHLPAHHGQPRPSSNQPDYPLPGTSPIQLCRDRRRTRAPTKRLTQTALR